MRHSKTGPGYRRQKSPSGDRAFVKLGESRVYLGAYGSPESKIEYHRVLSEWETNRGHPSVDKSDLRVCELLDRFLPWAQDQYRKPDGTCTGTLWNYKTVIRVVRAECGALEVAAFGVPALDLVRRRMIAEGWVRTSINRNVHLVRGIFRWGAERGYVDAAVYHALLVLKSLKFGKHGVSESVKRLDVPIEHVQAVKPFVSKQVWALIQLQLATGARAGEIVALRPIDINTGVDPWEFSPTWHKTAYKGAKRVIRFGPRAQAVILEFLTDRPVDRPLFSAREAEKDRHAAAETHRRENQSPNPVKSDRAVRDAYDVASYGRAIARACVEAKVPRWSSHQLRHAAATAIASAFPDQRYAAAVLGHSSLTVTDGYTHDRDARAIEVTRKLG